MGTTSKVYVIDPGEAGAYPKDDAKRGTERTDYMPDETAQSGAGRGGRERARIEEKGSPHMAFLSYLAGPFAVLTTRRGRDSGFWTTIAVLSLVAAAGAAVAREYELFAASHGSGVAYLIWFSVACLAALMGFAAWARGVYLLGRHKGWLVKKLPAWIRHPSVAGIIGFIVPGLGLFAVNRSRRAVAALIVICAAAVSAVVLWQAPEIWRLSQTAEQRTGFVAGLLAGRGDTLERMFLVMGALLCLGALAWIVQALDAVRLAGNSGGAKAQPRGDLAAIALVLAFAALALTFKPAQVAETIDHFAVAARVEGMRIIPLLGVQAAMRLDPSRPEYVMQAIELNEELGRPVEALVLLRGLSERWKPFDRMLRLEASAIESAVPSSAIP